MTNPEYEYEYDYDYDYDYEFTVLGGGSSGYAAARTAVDHGLKTAVVEGGDEVGGLCILRGCMPTKALLYAAEVQFLARHADVWGIANSQPSPDFPAVMKRKNALIHDFAEYRREQLQTGSFDFIRGHARFVDAHSVQIDNQRTLTSRHFLIATGSKVAPSPIEDLEPLGYWTSDDALRLEQLPGSLIVLGGGPVALEFAQFFSRMGTNVTLIQRSERVLKAMDPEIAEELQKALQDEGIQILTGTNITGVHEGNENEGGKTIELEHEGKSKRVTAEQILFALGRQPNTDALNLDAAGVQTEKGRILCDAFMRSSVPHIYAAGDCAGPHEIVHIAIQQGELAAHNAALPDDPKPIDYRLVMEIVFTDPQVATVGLSERQAREQGRDVISAQYPFNDHGKSMIMNAQHGFVKLIADKHTGEIVGGACVGPVGGELLHEITVAMSARMTAAQFAAIPHYHPTLAEIWTYPAEELADATGSD